jgi:hypothetical protein
VQKGAPVNYFLTEGAGAIGVTAVFKNAPHLNTAWLFAQTRPEKIYPVGAAELKEWSRYEKIWKGIFKLR